MRKQTGFTLVELVVVVMILGILAAVAAPKLLGTSTTASENGLKQTLAVVRDAIERYAAEKGGTLPRNDSEANFTADLKPYLRGSFPVCPVGNKNAAIKLVAGNGPITSTDISGAEGWAYCKGSGEFVCNSTAASPNDPLGPKYWQW
jgi:prepilin-type N-terminal cleavage/methylation domain-containing protein